MRCFRWLSLSFAIIASSCIQFAPDSDSIRIHDQIVEGATNMRWKKQQSSTLMFKADRTKGPYVILLLPAGSLTPSQVDALQIPREAKDFLRPSRVGPPDHQARVSMMQPTRSDVSFFNETDLIDVPEVLSTWKQEGETLTIELRAIGDRVQVTSLK